MLMVAGVIAYVLEALRTVKNSVLNYQNFFACDICRLLAFEKVSLSATRLRQTEKCIPFL